MQVVASFGCRGRVGRFFAPAERRIAIARFDAGFMRRVGDVIGIRGERFPFFEFVDSDGTREGSAGSQRWSDGGMWACRPVLGGEPIETHREHGDEREAQPDQHKGRGIRDHGNS
ncbi:hypothetical protein WS61_05910 [Burkholderia sp. ABCPW 11]|nr:hypothetical protein WS61_05910 [Burkholderia sp. ABCPW 11]